MLEKDRFLKKTSLIFFIFILIVYSKISSCVEYQDYLLNYNTSLKNTSFSFIQSDGTSIEEGELYIGEDRIKILYLEPNKITMIVSKNKGMYVNHDLKETQFFDTKKTLVNVFFNIIWDKSFFENAEIINFKNSISIKKTIYFNNIENNIEVKYQDEPLLIRKIIIKNNDQNYELGFFNHTSLKDLEKKFFSMINPYIQN